MIYSKDNVTFNNVLTSVVSVGTGGPLTAKTKYRVDENGNIVHRDSDYLVNAIDIHWGGITVDDKTINDTCELINWIKDNQSSGGPVPKVIKVIKVIKVLKVLKV